MLGRGQFGTVYRGKLLGKDVAVKRLAVQEFDVTAMSDLEKESQIMSRLRHVSTF
jgi:serine/threonine protein kinase